MNSPSDRDPGYLALLLERVLPGEPLLQRRQPALFEPVQARAGNWRHEAVAEVESAAPAPREHDRGDVVAQQAPWVRPPSPLPQEAPPRRSHELDAEAPPQATTGSSSRETVVRHETTLLREPPHIDATVRFVTVAAPAAASPRAPAVVAPAATTTASPRPDKTHLIATATPPLARTPVPAAMPPVHESARRAVPLQGDTPPLRRNRAATTPQPAVAVRSPLPTPAPSRAAARAVALAAARRDAPVPQPRELPPVEVTIGRVEVHAVAAPAAAPRSTRAAPQLSLEQYLSERNGGVR